MTARESTPHVGVPASSGPSLKEIRASLAKDVLDKTLAPLDFLSSYGTVVDTWLVEVFNRATKAKTRGVSLLAVGGHGRHELYPGSDIDLVLMHHARRDFQRIAHEIWYEIWDTGIRLDHSVRTRREAISVAETDLKVILGLLDGRVIAGDPRTAKQLLDEIPEVWQRCAPPMLREFHHQVDARHDQFGDVAFLLEPDLKQSAGGLRDLGVLRSLAIAYPQLVPLVSQQSIIDAERVIASARVVLHCRTASGNDRLLLQEQDQIAQVLSYGDADELMAKVAEAGRTIASASKEAWRRIYNEFNSATRSYSLGNGIVLSDGEVGLEESADATNPELVIAIGRAAIEHNVPINIASLDRLASQAQPPSTPWPSSLRDSFVSLLSTGSALIPVVDALDQRHLFELLVPEWTHVRNRPQRNAFHRYTVDRHLLETVALCAGHFGSIDRTDLLIMGALLHDIGKGQPGDHSEVGSAIAETVAQRMGFKAADVVTLSNLVAYHLVIPEFAIRRDLDDPSTALVVSRLVGNKETLELLAALTEVDSRATGTAAWGPWKAELVTQLVERVSSVLDGHPIKARPLQPTAEQLQLLTQRKPALRATGKQVTVVAPDRPGLLATVAGVLALSGCNVKRANLSEGAPGMALETFHIEPAFDRPIDWSHVEKELINTLDTGDSLDERLDERDDTYKRSRRPASATPARLSITVDNETSDLASIIEVHAPDRLGLLHDIASAFAHEHHDLVAALVDTLGHEVIDTFYVRNSDGLKLTASQFDAVHALLEAVITRAN